MQRTASRCVKKSVVVCGLRFISLGTNPKSASVLSLSLLLFSGDEATYKVVTVILLRRRIRRCNKRKHRFWVRQIFRKRLKLGEMKLFQEMHDNDRESFIMSFHVNPDQFDYILLLISERIAKDSTGSQHISAAQRLAVTLRHL